MVDVERRLLAELGKPTILATISRSEYDLGMETG
jgi:hypothetical protein